MRQAQAARAVAAPAERLVRAATSPRVAWALVAVGVVLRSVHYAFDRSLWIDESFIALNVLTKPWHSLAGTLDYTQGAPLGFLAAEKALTDAFGSSAYVLRLVPYLAALAALPAFLWLSRRVLPALGANVALALFVVCASLSDYGDQVKQYSLDVAVTIVLLAVLVATPARELTRRYGVGLAALGIGAIWLSHAAVFVLSGAGVAIGVAALVARDRARMRGYTAIFSAWAAALAVEYVVSLRHLTYLEASWRSVMPTVYAPLPSSGSGIRWYAHAISGMFTDGSNVGLPRAVAVLAALLAVLGLVGLYRRVRTTAFVIVLPIVVALAASALDRFPWVARFRLFVVPIVLLLVAAGAVELPGAVSRSGRGRVAAVAGFAATGVVTAIVVVTAAYHGVNVATARSSIEEIKPALVHLRQGWRPSDELYLYGNSQYAFRYYVQYRGYDTAPGGGRLWPIVSTAAPQPNSPALRSVPPTLLVGPVEPPERTAYARDVARLRPGRVWLLFAHYTSADLDYYLARLDRIGTRRETFRSRGVELVRYDVHS